MMETMKELDKATKILMCRQQVDNLIESLKGEKNFDVLSNHLIMLDIELEAMYNGEVNTK